MLRFSEANAKIQALNAVPSLSLFLKGGRKVYSFDLLSGWSCPFAKDCLAKVHVTDEGRKLKDGPDTQFRCFSASQEVAYPAVYNIRKANFDGLRRLDSASMVEAIEAKMPPDMGICRIHVAGDFFNQAYFYAWLSIAARYPNTIFYAYTKSIRYWVDCLNVLRDVPNFILTASRGGREDFLIEKYNLRTAEVVFSEEEAANKNLEIDHDDSHAADPNLRNDSFALLIHGVQPAKSEASKAIQTLRKNKTRYSYAR